MCAFVGYYLQTPNLSLLVISKMENLIRLCAIFRQVQVNSRFLCSHRSIDLIECKGVIRPSKRAGYNRSSLYIFVGWLGFA